MVVVNVVCGTKHITIRLSTCETVVSSVLMLEWSAQLFSVSVAMAPRFARIFVVASLPSAVAWGRSLQFKGHGPSGLMRHCGGADDHKSVLSELDSSHFVAFGTPSLKCH